MNFHTRPFLLARYNILQKKKEKKNRKRYPRQLQLISEFAHVNTLLVPQNTVEDVRPECQG